MIRQVSMKSRYLNTPKRNREAAERVVHWVAVEASRTKEGVNVLDPKTRKRIIRACNLKHEEQLTNAIERLWSEGRLVIPGRGRPKQPKPRASRSPSQMRQSERYTERRRLTQKWVEQQEARRAEMAAEVEQRFQEAERKESEPSWLRNLLERHSD
jgi:hypothetical protein